MTQLSIVCNETNNINMNQQNNQDSTQTLIEGGEEEDLEGIFSQILRIF